MKAYLYAAVAALALTSAPASARLLQLTITNIGGVNNAGDYSFQFDDTRQPIVRLSDSVRFSPVSVTFSNVPGVGAGTVNTGLTVFAPIQQGGLGLLRFNSFPIQFQQFRLLNTVLVNNQNFTGTQLPDFKLGTFLLSTTPQNNGPRPFDNYRVTIAAIPEPASWAMMIGGFAAVGLGLRRKARAVTA
jgi:hypothetical protein